MTEANELKRNNGTGAISVNISNTQSMEPAVKPRLRHGATCIFNPAALIVAAVVSCAFTTFPLQAQGNQRPFSDFLQAQGSTTCFTPPAPAQLGWATGPNKTNGNANLTPPRFALIDYTGVEAKYLLNTYGINLGTTVSGNVTERPLADGHAHVAVDLFAHNAMAWAFNIDPSITVDPFNSTPLAFGARVLDIVHGATPALGDVHLRLEFVNQAPGAPLPDLVAANADPLLCPVGLFAVPLSWNNIDFLSLQASITGKLHAPNWPEGTPGRLDVVQIGMPSSPKGSGPLSDAFPVESVALYPNH